MPTSACAYSGASFGSKPRLLNSRPRMSSTWVAMSEISEAKEPVDWGMGESRTRMRKPSVYSSM